MTQHPITDPIYQAVCTCGYGGPPYLTHEAAESDGDEHVIQMTRVDESTHRVEVVSGPPR
jgi:hypothetical protein